MKKYILYVIGVVLGITGLSHASEESMENPSYEFYNEFQEAVMCRMLDKIKALLDKNPDLLHVFFGHRGWTALHYAAAHCDVELMNILVRYGAYVNAEANDGRTRPLDANDIFLTIGTRKMENKIRYLVLSGAQVDDDLELIWQSCHKQSLRGMQKEYREKQQKTIQETTGFPRVLAALILDFEKGKADKKRRATIDNANFEKDSPRSSKRRRNY